MKAIADSRRASILTAVVAVACACVLASPAQAQLLNLAGNWNLTANGLLPGETVPCMFEGSGQMIQDGAQLMGNATLMLISGPPACPAEMMALLDGILDGTSFFGTLDGGQMFGMLSFQGTVAGDGNSIEGGFSVNPGGPFGDTSGGWNALRQQQAALPIPTLTGAGLSALVLLLAAVGFLLLRHR